MTNYKKILVLEIPFSKKDDAKKYGARWDPDNKYWYILNDTSKKYTFNTKKRLYEGDNSYLINNYIRIDFQAEYKEKDFIKSNGGKWDNFNKTWYSYNSNIKLCNYYDYDALPLSICCGPNDIKAEAPIIKSIAKDNEDLFLDD
jgi:hypothetical protein